MTTTNPAPAALNDEARARISALIDGELVGDEHERAIDALLSSDELARFWHDCHRAGDCLRSDEVGEAEPCAEFMERLSIRLAAEPAIVAPQAMVDAKTPRAFWLRTGLPSASVAAAIAVVAWVAIPNGHPDVASPVASSAPSVQPVAAGSASSGLVVVDYDVTPRKPIDTEQISDYLAAHGDVSPFAYRGGASARPASFVKPVAEVGR